MFICPLHLLFGMQLAEKAILVLFFSSPVQKAHKVSL